ncbi:MAG: thiopurine S-methyltransferase [Gammaproteobacteria bacterium]|nr:thiopurine S-methyltransferase [Gammaproteobacteria bacterium]
MKAEFWIQRWDNNQIGFHLNEVNPYLRQFFSELGLNEGQKILVPLCGKSLDLMWLAEQGLQVIGVELSRQAVEQFFSEQGMQAQIVTGDGFEIWRAGNITLYCGDFFDLTEGVFNKVNRGQVDAVYDRASMIALPFEMRALYVQQLARLCPVSVPRLLVSLNYEQDKLDGPPFAVSQDEISGYFSKVFKIKQLLAKDVLDENEQFRMKGLDHLEEAVYLLR